MGRAVTDLHAQSDSIMNPKFIGHAMEQRQFRIICHKVHSRPVGQLRVNAAASACVMRVTICMRFICTGTASNGLMSRELLQLVS